MASCALVDCTLPLASHTLCNLTQETLREVGIGIFEICKTPTCHQYFGLHQTLQVARPPAPSSTPAPISAQSVPKIASIPSFGNLTPVQSHVFLPSNLLIPQSEQGQNNLLPSSSTQPASEPLHGPGKHGLPYQKKQTIPCPHCDYRCVRSDAMFTHIAVTHEGKKPFGCNLCPYRSSDQAKLTLHLAAFHNVSKPKPESRSQHLRAAPHPRAPADKTIVKEKRKFPCTQCGYIATQKARLLQHVLSLHDGLKPHACPHPQCEFRASNPGSVRRHVMAVHEHLKPHACNRCDFRTARKDKLKRHMLGVHDGRQPYICPLECDYRTSWKENLTKHLASIHKKKPEDLLLMSISLNQPRMQSEESTNENASSSSSSLASHPTQLPYGNSPAQQSLPFTHENHSHTHSHPHTHTTNGISDPSNTHTTSSEHPSSTTHTTGPNLGVDATNPQHLHHPGFMHGQQQPLPLPPTLPPNISQNLTPPTLPPQVLNQNAPLSHPGLSSGALGQATLAAPPGMASHHALTLASLVSLLNASAAGFTLPPQQLNG
eukprot:TRINITY_DN520_c0_g1::TRINITY_DN520_c0_g1_i1::g.10575::m.10575 TRINITY_DN520_c0_g1::TRINITY_DN520_c0_g1_i1::g.10575  ORF type:complete len:545 (-),score=8.90,sp/P23607/ZFA_MOUSE/29.95/1e-17,sp/P23607/ZFA_MOUSE/28.33/2e-14,sp/P23607/ZFA_MOUSE/24.74/3e-09,sp/P23607/ZFA_MOUSE/25.00/1e-08,sp/P23607/ZFA_MOUSE/27.01/2e-08,zf-H2C2_5/PF13909.1/1.9,zf-H2C2_5/PF13909.1/0.0011,zf-H2C2_5/PF13909.1/0.56,zf-H2C2_5/PF13909.1/11,zf-H2C2_5/PF13909.1/0.022,zf-H2C2_5/PF13909.1/0.0018,zf-C2H2_4/PF13894.1/2.7,zf-C2H2